MKSKRILSALLTGVMCFSVALPAFGASSNESMYLVNGDEAVLSIGQEQINVKAYDDMDLDQAAIQDFYQRVQAVKSEELPNPSLRSAEPVDCFEYTLMSDDATYFYEESFDGENKNIFVFDTQIVPADEAAAVQVNEIQSKVDLPGGIGGRLSLHTSYGDYISGTVQTPLKSQISGINNSPVYNYIYTGFSGKTSTGAYIESDIGLQYCVKESIGGWNHYFFMGGITVDDPISSYPDVTGSNFFLTSDASNTRKVNFTTYKNYNGTGYVRSKLEGYARYNNAQGTGTAGAYYKVSVKELNESVSTISKWKLLNTITSETVSGLKSWCKITNVTLNGGTPSESYITREEDYATVTPVFSGGKLSSVTFNVSK